MTDMSNNLAGFTNVKLNIGTGKTGMNVGTGSALAVLSELLIFYFGYTKVDLF